MEDRDGKKPFIIPKTHTSNKNVLISEKPDSRNVTELFDDIKSCALEAHFDFRQNECKSCDTIRNQKLQKLYNEKRLQMKKDQDPIERLAFHLIAYRDVALNVATDGLNCEQLSFSIEKNLGDPKDGVHLSRRPDVLLTSSGAQGLYRFGLLVCKVLLGKGYATIPSTSNNQFAAQLHYDHHFCKVQPINKEQRHIDDLLANSLIFCYEHENFQTIPRPPQILPIAILWYDLTEKFPPELISTTTTTTLKIPSNQESQHRSGKTNNVGTSKRKTSNLSTKPVPSLLKKPIISQSISHSGTWEGPIQDPPTTETTQNPNTTETSIIKYPSQFMVPYHRPYSHPPQFPSISTEPQQPTNTNLQLINSRDPRLLRKRETSLISSETIPLSPQHLMHERSISDVSLSIKSLKTSSDESLLITRSSSLIQIPLNSSVPLLDPRIKTLKQTRNIFYLELHAVKHALQQQKRLNHYYDSKSGLPPKTSYTLIPYLIRQVSIDEYERLLNDDNNTYKFTKHSNGVDYSSLYVTVVDCFNFGLLKSGKTNENYIDLEQNENKLAFEQIEISNELIQREKQLNSQQIRLRLREKRQRKMQQQINEKQSSKTSSSSSSISPSSSTSLTGSKLYIATGRQLLKEHKISSLSPTLPISSDLLDFFSREYKNENRPHVKHLLAELVGIFIEKYHFENNQTTLNNGQYGAEDNQHSAEEPVVDDQTINFVIDMDLDSPSSQGLGDHDERFRVPTPPPPPPLPPPLPLPPLPPPSNETVYTQSIPSLLLTQTLSTEPNKIFDDPNYNNRCHKLVEQLKEQYRQMETSSVSTAHLPTKSEAILPTEDTVFKACLGQFESSSSENSPINDINSLTINEDLHQQENILIPVIQDDSNRSRDEFVKLLTKEAFISKSSSPAKVQNNHKRLYPYRNRRRRSFDDNDKKKSLPANRSNSYRRPSRLPNNKTRRRKSPYPSNKKGSSTRTVTLVSNRSTISNENQDNKQTNEIPKGNQNDLQPENEEEPIIKRLKIDSILPTTSDTVENTDETNQNNLSLKSVVTIPTITDDHDYRRDLDGRRRTTASVVSTTDNPINKSSRSRSRSKSKDHNNEHDHHRQRRRSSTNSRSSSIKTSSKSNKTISESIDQTKKSSRSSSVSSRTSSINNKNKHNNNNNHRGQRKQNSNDHRHDRRRSSDHHKQYSNQSADRHEFFNEMPYRNSLPSAYHQRNTNDLILPNSINHLQNRQPVRHRRFNYNHQSVAAHPRFANLTALPSPTPLMDFNYPKSPTHHRSTSPVTIGDRNLNSSYYQTNYNDQFESSTINYSNCFDTKPSNTIERLQMFLQNKTTEQSQIDYSVNQTAKYSSPSTNTDNSHWSSSSYSSTTTPDTIVQNNNNNQTFTYTDAEQLLMMVQRLRN